MEGIPVVLMEAMASGLPVISTRHSGIPELVIDRQNGILVPEKCDVSIKEALSDLIHNYEDRFTTLQNARRTIEDSFDIDNLNRSLHQILNSLHP